LNTKNIKHTIQKDVKEKEEEAMDTCKFSLQKIFNITLQDRPTNKQT